MPDPITETKSIFTSKTFWANTLALIAMVVQGVSGKEIINLEIQGVILSVVNIILRMVTKQSVTWQ